MTLQRSAGVAHIERRTSTTRKCATSVEPLKFTQADKMMLIGLKRPVASGFRRRNGRRHENALDKYIASHGGATLRVYPDGHAEVVPRSSPTPTEWGKRDFNNGA